MGKHHKNTLRRIRLVCDIVQRHYEPGNHAKSYFQVWRKFVNPVYPMTYITLMKYVNTPLGALEAEEQDNNKRQLKLFDDETN